MLKGLGNLTSMIKQAQALGGRLHELNDELKNRRATGTSGGGMVTVEVNGLLEVLSCRIDEKLVEQSDRELIEDLVTAAINHALSKGRQLHADSIKSLAGGIELPGLDQMLSQLTGGETPDSKETSTDDAIVNEVTPRQH